MSIKFRRLLFYSLVLAFLIASGVLLFYSSGWVFNFTTFAFEKTGGLLLKTSPQDIIIKINNKTFKDDSGFLNNSTIIKDLTPGPYNVEVQKDGYQTWKKQLEVLPGLVTAAKTIILPPNIDKSGQNLIASSVQDFYISRENNIYVRKLAGKIELLGKGAGSTAPVQYQIQEIFSDSILATDQKENYILVPLQKPASSTNISELFWRLKEKSLNLPGQVKVLKAAFRPSPKNEFLIVTGGGVYSLEIKDSPVLKLLNRDNINKPIIYENKIFWLDENQDLTFLNLEKNATTSIGLESEIQELTISPDLKKVALLERSGNIKIIALEDFEFDFPWPKFSSLEITDEKTDKKSLTWASDSNHLLFKSGNNLVLSEIDNRSNINQHVIAENVKKFLIDRRDGGIYVLTEVGELLKI